MGPTEHRTLSFKHMVTPILLLHSSLICVGTPNFVLLTLARALLGFGVLSESGEKYGRITSLCVLLMGSEPSTTTATTTTTNY